MEARIFKVNLDVLKTYQLLLNEQDAILIDHELKTCGENNLAILVYEKYYFRVKNKVSLVIIVDDMDGYTRVKVLGTGGGTALSSNFDWGAGNHFENSVIHVLKDYIVKSDE